MKGFIEDNPWQGLRRLTPARIALGRAGDSAPTRAVLDFGLAHAQARDAVHVPLDTQTLRVQLAAAGYDSELAASAAADRAHYVRRPDQGRRLSAASRAVLCARSEAQRRDLAFVIGDGLSAIAPQRHAVPLLQALRPRLTAWSIAPVVIAQQARVALGDEVGELWQAGQVIVLIGERPGLSSPDSLGIYLTYAPRVGRTDAERNCISNVRRGGLDYEEAAHRLHWLISAARRLRGSGVALKDESDRHRPSGAITRSATAAAGVGIEAQTIGQNHPR